MNLQTITSPDVKFSEDKIYYFRKNLSLDNPKNGVINIIADARYKLWVNGNMASFGPYKSSSHKRYYDTVDIGKYLKTGENQLFVEVLQLSSKDDIGKYKFLNSVSRSGGMALMAWGEIDGVAVETDESWECAFSGITMLKPLYSYFCGSGEETGLNALAWKPAKKAELYDTELYFKISSYGEIYLWNMEKCGLPPQRYEVKPFSNKDSVGNYDYGKVVTGFVRVKARGKGQLKLTYAESYVFVENGDHIKRDRTDTNGEIIGDYDIINVDGEATREFFWFRTFRFIKVEGDAELVSLEVAETGYPLKVCETYDFGTETDNKLWEMCVNSLKCCMHETYEDCPYYEQLQYAMDTFMQMVFNMRLDEDCRLVKRGINDFASSVSGVDISMSRYPVATPQYILGFSLFIVFMLDALEKNRGEHSFIKKYLGTVDIIFSAFEERKRQDGLLGKGSDWSFVDWAGDWKAGVPHAEQGDAITVYNLMYAVALEKAARLCRIFGRKDTAAEYEKNAEGLKQLVKEKCYCQERGLYADTDKKTAFSQHPQVWAVLAGIVDTETGKRIMRESISLDTKGGFAYAYFVFRALEAVDEYALSADLLSLYHKLLEMNCTTVPEEPNNPRSECHAWGAVLINEFTTMILGVKENEGAVLVKPYIEGRDYAKGTVFTKYGRVDVSWKLCGGKFEISVKAESDVPIIAQLPNGQEIKALGALNTEMPI